MSQRVRKRRGVEQSLAVLVAAGVAGTGIFDFSDGQPPQGVLGLGPDASFALFLVFCGLAAVLGVALAKRGASPERATLRSALVVVSVLCIACSDPTYTSMIMTIPLIEIRRREPDPTRTLWLAGIVAVVAALVLTESTRRTTTEIEAMLVLALALLVVVHFGDALREVDRRVESEAELAKLTERSRLAEDLHDSLGHHLLASSLQLRKAKTLRQSDPGSSAAAVEFASQAVAEAISETRLIVDATRNGDAFAVDVTLRDLVARIVPTDITMRLEISGDHGALDPATQVVIYRVAQEALTNLVRHSGATEAELSSVVDVDAITIRITDNGQGFDAAATTGPGGIDNMRRRTEEIGGSLAVTSTERGTTVTASVPR